jgi:hypothetical protein
MAPGSGRSWLLPQTLNHLQSFSDVRIQHCNPTSSTPNSMLPVVLLAEVAEIGGRKVTVIPSLQSSNHLLRSLFRTPCSALNSSSLSLRRYCSFKGAAGGSGGGDGGGDGVFSKSHSNAILIETSRPTLGGFGAGPQPPGQSDSICHYLKMYSVEFLQIQELFPRPKLDSVSLTI